MKKIITVKLWNRPPYLKKLVDSLEKLSGIEEYKVIFSVDKSGDKETKIIKHILENSILNKDDILTDNEADDVDIVKESEPLKLEKQISEVNDIVAIENVVPGCKLLKYNVREKLLNTLFASSSTNFNSDLILLII